MIGPNPLSLPMELSFTSEQLQQELVLSNPTESVILFKIKSTDRDMLELRHFEGAIVPASKLAISIVLKHLEPAREKKIKLLVQWALTPNDELSKSRRIESLPKDEVYSKQILVVERLSEKAHSLEMERAEMFPMAEQSHPSTSQTTTVFLQPSRQEGPQLSQKLQMERANNAQLSGKCDRLTKEYMGLAAQRQEEAAKTRGNGPVLVLLLIGVFLAIYYCGKFISEL